MIEVLFADSEAASMRAAKSTVIYSRTDGPTSVFIAGKKKPPGKGTFRLGWKKRPMMLSVLAIRLGYWQYTGKIFDDIIGKFIFFSC